MDLQVFGGIREKSARIRFGTDKEDGMSGEVRCRECSQVLDESPGGEDRRPCPNCGSKVRLMTNMVRDGIVLEDTSPNERARRQIYLEGLLRYPGENPEVDYKAAVWFRAKEDFSRKLVRHVLGMANAGGGEIVIGFCEEGTRKPAPDPAMTEEICASYEATSFSQFVGKFVRDADGPRVTVDKVTHEGVIYPILSVQPFEKEPFFCCSTVKSSEGKRILLEDEALYVRDPKTRTVKVASPDQFRDLITRCVRMRQSEMIDQFGKIIESIRTGTPPANPEPTHIDAFKEIVEREHTVASLSFHQDLPEPAFYYFWYAPVRALLRRPYLQLREAMRRASYLNSRHPMGLIGFGDTQASPVEDGLRMSYSSRDSGIAEHWFLHESGGFFLARPYDEGAADRMAGRASDSVHWRTRVWRLAEALDLCIALYAELEATPDTLLEFQVAHGSLRQRKLWSGEMERSILPGRVSAVDEVRSKWGGTLGLLQVERKAIIRRFSQELFERFDYFSAPEDSFNRVYEEYLSTRQS